MDIYRRRKITMGEEREIKTGDIVYYARIMPTVDIFDVVKLKIRRVTDNFFVGLDDKTKHALMFNYRDIGNVIFFNRKDALNKVNAAEDKKTKRVSKETYYEEY